MTQPFADHFSSIARDYAAARPSYPAALFDWLASAAPARREAWDCAAGSGQATLGLARHFAHVTATDASVEQLAEAPRHPRVSYRTALAHASGLSDGSTDLVAVAQALHWLDVEAFYEEVRRVLVPGGVLCVWCYGLPRLDISGIDSELERFYGAVVGRYWPPERRMVETGYADLRFPFDEAPAPAFEMIADWTLAELMAYVGTWSATERCRRVEGGDPLGPFAAELAPRWGDTARPRRVRWPLSVRIGRRPSLV